MIATTSRPAPAANPPVIRCCQAVIPAYPAVMGVLNVTRIHSDGGRLSRRNAPWAQARRLIAEGADIIDIARIDPALWR